jgi:oligoribonuclease
MAGNLVWMDLEMTGLDVEDHVILEIATIVTDGELNVLAEGPNIVIHQPEDELQKMDDWCVQHHGASGLTAKVRASKIDTREAELETLEFIKKWVGPREAPLCGNSIWQDRRFIGAYMRELDAYLHYRIVDVSSIKELTRRWYPTVKSPGKGASHRALDDIRESIEELRYYREQVFK